MTTILAALDDSHAADPVLQVARQLAATLGVTCRPVHICRRTAGVLPEHSHLDIAKLSVLEGEPVAEIVDAARDPSVVAVVIGSRSDHAGPVPAGHIATAVIERACKPVVVVPPGAEQRGPLDRALIPLEGTTKTSAPIVETATKLIEAGVDLIALHVFDIDTVPHFWDDLAHSGPSFVSEFKSLWWQAPSSPVGILLRRGDPATVIVDVARREQVDLIVLGWSQDLGAGHAKVVRAAMSDTHIPVLLVPVRR